MAEQPSATEPTPTPRPIAWMDGRVVPASEATIPLLDDGFLRGDAVFDAVLVRRGHTHALDAHLARLRRSAKRLGIRVPVLSRVVGDLLLAWGDRDGCLKLIVTRGDVVRGILHPLTAQRSIALQPVETIWETALTGVKTLSYAANMLAQRQARRAHADDALIVVDEVVHELPTGAVTWWSDGRWHACDPEQLPILDSITLQQLGRVVEVEFGVHTLDAVLEAEEVAVVSASRPILPVHAVDEAEYPAPGPQTQEARAALDAHIDATLDPRP